MDIDNPLKKTKKPKKDKANDSSSTKQYSKGTSKQTRIGKALTNLKKALTNIRYNEISEILNEFKSFDTLPYLNAEMFAVSLLFIKQNGINQEEDITAEMFTDHEIKEYLDMLGNVTKDVYIRYKANILRYVYCILNFRNPSNKIL